MKKYAFLSVFLVVALLVAGSALFVPQQAKAATTTTVTVTRAEQLGMTQAQYSTFSTEFYIAELSTQVLSLKLQQAVQSMADEIAGMGEPLTYVPTANDLAAIRVEVTQIGVRLNYLAGVNSALNQVKATESTISTELYN